MPEQGDPQQLVISDIFGSGGIFSIVFVLYNLVRRLDIVDNLKMDGAMTRSYLKVYADVNFASAQAVALEEIGDLPSCKTTAIATENSCGHNRSPGQRLNKPWKRNKSS